jgi:hypothetical protein
MIANFRVTGQQRDNRNSSVRFAKECKIKSLNFKKFSDFILIDKLKALIRKSHAQLFKRH